MTDQSGVSRRAILAEGGLGAIGAAIPAGVAQARDLGIDLTANDQPMEPTPLAPKQAAV